MRYCIPFHILIVLYCIPLDVAVNHECDGHEVGQRRSARGLSVLQASVQIKRRVHDKLSASTNSTVHVVRINVSSSHHRQGGVMVGDDRAVAGSHKLYVSYSWQGSGWMMFALGVLVTVCLLSLVMATWIACAISRGLTVMLSFGGKDARSLLQNAVSEQVSALPTTGSCFSVSVAYDVSASEQQSSKALQLCRESLEEACEQACREYGDGDGPRASTASSASDRSDVVAGSDATTASALEQTEELRQLSSSCSESTPSERRCHLIDRATEAASRCRYFEAQEFLISATALDDVAARSVEVPELEKVSARVRSFQRLIESCAPPTSAEWSTLGGEEVIVWRSWDKATGKLHLIMQYDAVGTMQQQIAALRDADVAEPLWGGACWDMSAEHGHDSSLVRWLQKDPFTGKRTEVLVERLFCDCLDTERPCWVMSEKSPDVQDIENFSGRWGGFDIQACPQGCTRTITAESGRVIEPLGNDKCRVSITLSLQLPSMVRWFVTDSAISFACRMSAKSSFESWTNLIEGWESSGFEERIQREAAFYAPLEERMQTHTTH